jgi:hypothetical protein
MNGNGASLEVILESLIGTSRWQYGTLLSKLIKPGEIFNDQLEDKKEVENDTKSQQGPLRTDEELQFEPGSYIEIIPWMELTKLESNEVPRHCLQQSQDSQLKQPYSWVLWKGCPQPCLSYHFVSEEGQLQSRLCDSFDDGGDDGCDHVFIVTPLDGSFFCSDYKRYWALWVRNLSLTHCFSV